MYDHAPVWVFVKSPRYSSAIASELLGKVDLSKIENQIPSETRVKPFRIARLSIRFTTLAFNIFSKDCAERAVSLQ